MTRHRSPILRYHPAAAVAIAVCLAVTNVPAAAADDTPELTAETAQSLSLLALGCIQREYPNKPGHVMNDESEVKNPAALHPAFYGCFDWHSAVHGHWTLVRLLKMFPDMPNGGDIRAALDQNLTAENILGEVAYLEQPNRKSFERTYGWAWLLKLAEELHDWDDPDGVRWSQNLEPLADEICGRYVDFLPRQTYPIRRGVHANTAFGIAFALDYARATGRVEMIDLLTERSLDYFSADANYPASWEPGGDDFFSPALMEADLMRRVLPPEDFRQWFGRFLPDAVRGGPENLMTPAVVADRADPKIAHLDGLNFSRAWCMAGIATVLPPGSRSRRTLEDAARLNAAAALANVASGHYEGEHWLASFAVYTLSTFEGLGNNED
ncbi:MAG: DUF2891 domain-containing protein [Candidatus Latescibacterota bacterium]|jgi:hypothetical protein